MQITIGDLQVVSLLESFAATVLCVAAIFQRTSLLLQSYDFLARTTVQSLVQLAHSQRHQQIVVNQVVGIATRYRAAVAARIAASAAGAFASIVARVVHGAVVVREARRQCRS